MEEGRPNGRQPRLAHLLFEGTPPDFSVDRIETEMTCLQGTINIHHVHVWSLTDDKPIVTLHAHLSEGTDRQEALAAILERLRKRLDCEHATVQIEERVCAEPPGVNECQSGASEIARNDHDRSDGH